MSTKIPNREQIQTWLTNLSERKVNFPAFSVKAIAIGIAAILTFSFYGSLIDSAESWWTNHLLAKQDKVIATAEGRASMAETKADAALAPVESYKADIQKLNVELSHKNDEIKKSKRVVEDLDRQRAHILADRRPGDVKFTDVRRRLDNLTNR